MRKIPLLVHLVFHPESHPARDLARWVHKDLNDDPVVPGLRVPTTFCAVDEGGRPCGDRLDDANRSFVVPLADDKLNASPEWSRFVGDLWERCRTSPHRFAPIQLSAAAWPLDDRLRGVNFSKACREDESKLRAFVVRRIVIELCRYLQGEALGGERAEAPVQVFISHTKVDFTESSPEPGVVELLIQHLRADKPVRAWTDAGEIPSGSDFGERIEAGVRNTSVLCVLTDRYASREWCRREVLLAKKHQRPVVVIDSLEGHEIRSFPYLGNVPVLRWRDDPEAATDLLLKETLRHLHTRIVLEQWRRDGDTVFVSPPELVTLLDLPSGATVLYPDPPVGVEENKLLAKTGLSVTTPLQRLAEQPSLKGRKVALSLSESTDSLSFGFDAVHLESAMLELTRYLLVAEATLAYGGHLGDKGYTPRLFELVRTHNAREDVKHFERIVNYLGWPIPRPDDKLASEHKAGALFRVIERPEGVDQSLHQDFRENPEFFPGDQSALHRYAWARGMTAMREQQTRETCARIVLGGVFGPTVGALPDGRHGEKWYFGRIPGLLEEVLVSAKAEQPVFLIGAFGGVARMVIDLLEGRDRPEATWKYQSAAPWAPEMRAEFEKRDGWWDYPEMVDFLRRKGVEGINPLLSRREHEELFHTRDLVRMIELVLLGLGRLPP